MKLRDSVLFAVLALSATTAAVAGCDDPSAPAKPGASASAPAGSAAAAGSGTASAAAKPLPPMPKADPIPAAPKYAPEMKIPADNPQTPEKVSLGKQLFFDKT